MFRARGQSGFTLIEMLVALAVFSLAALALLRLEGFTLRTAADLDRRLLAETVARNLMVETLTDPAAPAVGQSAGVATNGGAAWRWTRVVTRADDQRLLAINVVVAGQHGTSPAALTFVRPAT